MQLKGQGQGLKVVRLYSFSANVVSLVQTIVMALACLNLCCSCCDRCGESCRCPKKENVGKYPSVEYYTPEKAKEKVQVLVPDTSFHSVPLQKIFDFPQAETTGFQTCPQVRQPIVIREQPYGSELCPQPVYVTKKGRSHTLSQLPEDQGLREGTDSVYEHDIPEPPFTPPDAVPSHKSITESPDIPLDIDGPAIQFSVYYDIQRRTLSVHLYQAVNLPSINDGPQDSFVVIFLLPSRDVIHQTVTISNNRNPKYKQIFEFGGILAEEVYQQVLVFQVYYSDKFARDHLIGSVLIPLKEADLYGIVMAKTIGEGYDLLKKLSSGDLLLSLRCSKSRQKLQGIILKAVNLPRPHKWGIADPYVKVYMLHRHRRLDKWKSTTRKNTLAPVFNEPFEFDITGMDVRDICLEIFIMDHDRFRKNDVIGLAYVGLHVPSDSGTTHFNEVLSNLGQQISHWHHLIPHQQLKQRKRHKSNTM